MNTKSLWTNERTRGLIFQILLVVGIAVFFAFIISNTITNLEKAGLASGYSFLGDTASFDINQRLIEYSSTSTYGRAIIVGGLNTIVIAILGILAATVIGFVAGILRLSKNYLISRLVTIYVEFVRNVPVLLQIIFWWVILLSLPKVRNSLSIGDSIFLNNRGIRLPSANFYEGSVLVFSALIFALIVIYFIKRWSQKRQAKTGKIFPFGYTALGLIIFLPALTFLLADQPIDFNVPTRGRFNLKGGFNVTPELVALWLALSTYTAAFISEIVRSGILSVSSGQREAASALGLKPSLIMRKIILPQALRVIIPPLTSQYLNLTKNSSLAVAIGYQDIVSIGDTVLNQSGQALEVISIFMIFYLTLSLITSAFMNWYNKRIELVER
ncbi:MAG: amino acid ABC transporter permease [Alphaproteobacteria bacterium]|jgi:general L-amino acid transport system permease protein|nr:amino acid ABC transporter permease [Alphaproteobacteria bacterium]PPR14500.1 MAG: putative glutamine ABC transporter permease protein GlnM [Alphaproteobacteria bacterium MarineAlpha12_Bin1]